MMARHVPFALTLALAASAPALAADPNPYAKPDDSWITISGTAVDTKTDRFTLDYGDGTILVEVDDFDTYGEAYGMVDGDKVTVYGRVDADLYEKHKIEAGSVYVESLGTYFHASAADEESAPYQIVTSPIVVSAAHLTGTVTSVDPIGKTFTIDNGAHKITIGTDRLGYNPLDALGYQRIEPGDVLRVTGRFDRNLLDDHAFEATGVITLVEERSGAKRMN